MNKKYPIHIPWNSLFSIINPDNCSIYITTSVSSLVKKDFINFNITIGTPTGLNTKEFTLVIGGGKLIDETKIWKYENKLNTKIFIIPTLWGSGSEVNNIAVKLENNKKKPIVSDNLLPDYFSIHPAVHETLNNDLAMWGYGDVYAHAIEAFLSPLASNELRKDLSEWLNQSLLPMPFEKNSIWFFLSQQASIFQSSSGVGLIHGIAHELEPILSSKYSHARLSTIFLYPVLLYNNEKSDKFSILLEEFSIPKNILLSKALHLFNKDEYNFLLPYLNENWPKIIRNPLTRINSTSVNAQSIAWFSSFGEND